MTKTSLRPSATRTVCGALWVALGVIACLPPAHLGNAADQGVKPTHPQLIVDEVRLAELHRRAATGDPTIAALRKGCDARSTAKAGKPMGPGYMHFEWSYAATNYALCGLVAKGTDREAADRYWAEAVTYMKALARDLQTVGDGKGGLPAIRRDSGYPIRSNGVHLALAYDWAYEAPAFTPELKREFADQMVKWVDWYEGKLDGKGGYEVKGPAWGNYFSGYFLAKGLIGPALLGHHERAPEFVADARRLFREQVKPDLDDRLGGGYPPEGWAYGTGLIQRYLQYVLAVRTATGEDLTNEVRFFCSAVRAVVHGTKPDFKSIYDGGDWGGDNSGRPVPSGIIFMLQSVCRDQLEGAMARAYLQAVMKVNPRGGPSAFDRILYGMPEGLAVTPPPNESLSYHAQGTNLVTMRSSWREDAVWAAFQSGGAYFGGHQNRDQGHLAIWHKGKDLLIDAGMWREAPRPGFPGINNYANETFWHNSILIDDKGEHRLTYPPGQGVWGKRFTRAFEDGGVYVFTSADITGAYAPADHHVSSMGAKSAVEKVTRDLVYIRPRHFVVVDRIRTAKEYYGKRLVFHFANAAEPTVAGHIVESRYGDGKLVLQTIGPAGAVLERLHTPSTRCEKNPTCPSFTWRVEVRIDGGGKDHTFVHVLAAVDAGTPAAEVAGTAIPVEAGRAVGALIASLGIHTAVLVDPEGDGRGGPLIYRVPRAPRTFHLLFGMPSRRQYRMEAAPAGDDVRVTVTPDPAGGLVATPAGVLAFRSGS